MEELLIGREREREILNAVKTSQQSEFMAVYGRRRIGKTYLVRRFFNNQFAFFMTGIDNVSMQDQLIN